MESRDQVLGFNLSLMMKTLILAEPYAKEGDTEKVKDLIGYAERAIVADALTPIRFLLLEGMFGHPYNIGVA